MAATAPSSATVTDKSTRSNEDRAAGEQMGIACTRPIERVLASLGKLPGGAATEFESCRDVSYGGVLCALAALAENGLFRHLQATFPTLSGYYSTLHVILLLAYMALCRIRTVILPKHVAAAPHCLHHVPQIPQGGLVPIGVF